MTDDEFKAAVLGELAGIRQQMERLDWRVSRNDRRIECSDRVATQVVSTVDHLCRIFEGMGAGAGRCRLFLGHGPDDGDDDLAEPVVDIRVAGERILP